MGRIVNFELKRIIVRTFWQVLKLMPMPLDHQVRQRHKVDKEKDCMDGINVARTCDQLSAKLEAAYQRNGFLVRLPGGSGIVCTKFQAERSARQSNQIKTIITSNTKTKTQQLYARFVSQFYRHKHRLSFFRLRKTHKFTHSPLPFKFLPFVTQLQLPRKPIKSAENELMTVS